VDPNHANAHYNLGALLVARGEMGGAAAAFGSAASLDPGNADAHNNVGGCLLLAADYPAAIEAFQR
jgi:Flp pilus assembly protein TadD